jgi:membrane protein YdbS with pleckstrin-like domain
MTMIKTYKSAVDLWLAALLIGAPLVVMSTGVSVAFGLHILQWHGQLGWYTGVSLIGAGIAMAMLIGMFTLPCRYTLRETDLRIQCGIRETIVPYRNIRRLELSCSFWSAPALSLDRVKIVLDEGFHLISPKNRQEFIADLQSRLTT